MDQIYPDEGLIEQLEKILADGVEYFLFTNNVTPGKGTVLADLTPAGWTGSTAITLDTSDFATTGVTSHAGVALGAPISWTNGSGGDQTCYGYGVRNIAGTKLWAAARFDSAPITKADGESFTVVPIWGDSSQFG